MRFQARLLACAGMVLAAVGAACQRPERPLRAESGRVRPLVIERPPPRRVIVEHRRPSPGPAVEPRREVGPPVVIEPRAVGPPVMVEHLPPPDASRRRPRSMLHPDDQPVVIEQKPPPKAAREKVRRPRQRPRPHEEP